MQKEANLQIQNDYWQTQDFSQGFRRRTIRTHRFGSNAYDATSSMASTLAMASNLIANIVYNINM